MMQLDPRIRALLWLMRFRKPVYRMSLDEIQRMNQTPPAAILAWLVLGPQPPMARVINRTISGRHGDIPIRLYYPTAATALPLVVFFHGGGWVTGSFHTHDVVCRRVAQAANVLVAAVDYRLAPWHRFPIALEDCYDVTCWLAHQAHAIGARDNGLIVMGDSAGGNLATVVCLMARDQKGPVITRQILIYPAVDGTRSCPSHQHYPDAPLLPKVSMDFFLACYIRREADLRDPYFSPLLSPNLHHLPPALILSAQYDPLHDEAAAYSRRLEEAGVPVQYNDYPGMIHAFLNFPRFCPGAQPAFADIAAYIRDAVWRP